MKLNKNYINLLKSSLLNELYIENEAKIVVAVHAMYGNVRLEPSSFLGIKNQEFLIGQIKDNKSTGNTLKVNSRQQDGSYKSAPEARNLIELSHTMIGRKRLDNIQFAIETIIHEDIPGDFIETGIWRGGACIFMKGCLLAFGDNTRTIWAADSFQGVPEPTWEQDAGFDISENVLPILTVSIEEVKELFDRYQLLDDRVKFLEGWFRDTLPNAPIEKLSLLRLDGDLYESTMDALIPLYDKVVEGGFIIVDDYFSCPPCKKAITDFMAQNNIQTPLITIDGHSVYWRKN